MKTSSVNYNCRKYVCKYILGIYRYTRKTHRTLLSWSTLKIKLKIRYYVITKDKIIKHQKAKLLANDYNTVLLST